MSHKPGNIIGCVQFNVAAMDTGDPSILYEWSASDGNPFSFYFPATAQTMQLADQAGDQKQLFRALFLFALCVRSEKLV